MADPMDEGKLAAANGEPVALNPYAPNLEAHEEWLEGHSYVMATDEDGELLDNA